jgi:V8-like Glu-specific endopeptidase
MLNMRYLLPVLVILSSGLSAAAQTPPALFDGSFYGRSDLPIKQSTGNSASLVQASSGVFEPIHELRANDPLRLLSTPIGRLDLLAEQADGQQVVETCTAALLPGDYLLTNSHCVPGSPGLTLKSASLLMDYLVQGTEGERFEVSLKPAEFDTKLDYAILQASGNPTQKFGSIAIALHDVEPGESLVIFHHPMGQPKRMTRFRCLALKEQVAGPTLRHRCDTLPGSSGSLVFSMSDPHTVGLHYLGGMDAQDEASFNTASRMSSIYEASALLKTIVGGDHGPTSIPPVASEATTKRSAPPPAAKTLEGGLTTQQMNDLLRGR